LKSVGEDIILEDKDSRVEALEGQLDDDDEKHQDNKSKETQTIDKYKYKYIYTGYIIKHG
jgi:hypothetical protein